MADVITNKYLNLVGLTKYDELIKNYIDVADAKSFKTVFVDGDTIKFYKKENATVTDVADASVAIASSDVTALKELIGSTKLTTDAKTVTGAINELDGEVAAAQKAADDAQAAADAAQGEVDALEAKVGDVPSDKTVVQMITDAQAAATYDDTEVRGLIKDNADAIDVLNGSGEGSVDKKITDAFNDFSTKVSDDAVVNSYKELIDWAASHGSEAAEMAGAITTLENILAGIGGEGESTTVVAYVQAAIDALKIGDYAKAADLTAAVERIAAMEAKVADWDDAVAKEHEHANAEELAKIAAGDKAKWDAAEQNAKDYADGLADNYDAAGSAATAKEEAVAAAKEYSDGLNTAMDTRVKALEAVEYVAITDEEIAGLFV